MSTALVVMLINKCAASVKYPRWCWLILKALCWLWGKCFRAEWWSRLLKPSSHRLQRSAHADSQPLKSPLWSPYWSCWIQTVTSLQLHHHLYQCWGRYTTLSWATGVATYAKHLQWWWHSCGRFQKRKQDHNSFYLCVLFFRHICFST